MNLPSTLDLDTEECSSIRIKFILEWISDPRIDNPWNLDPKITPEEVYNYINQCYKGGKTLPTEGPLGRDAHIRKIAEFVMLGWDDPISIYLPSYLAYPIQDGNHRLYAAAILCDEGMIDSIDCNIEGDEQIIQETFEGYPEYCLTTKAA